MSLRGAVRRLAGAGAIGLAIMAAPALAGSGEMAGEMADGATASSTGSARPTTTSSPDGLLHDWRATLRYGRTGAPLKDDPGARIGDGHTSRLTVGLDAGIGASGFARISVGRGWRDGTRAFEFEDMASDAESVFAGVTGGAFVLPYLAIGLSLEYGHEDGADDFSNRFFPQVNRVEQETSTWHAAPFVLLTGPVGPVELSLLVAYLHQHSSVDYEVPAHPFLDSEDTGRLDLGLAELSAGMWVLPDLRLGASAGWTGVLGQRTPGAELPLDEGWATLGLNATWRLTDSIDLSIDASHDAGNARGNGHAWGVGLAYRF